jgi:GntR family transcriptional regulator/MocR family aminotransferase
MRALYAARLEALVHYGRRYLQGVLEISNSKAGLYTVAFLTNGISSRKAESLAAVNGLETRALDRFSLTSHDPKGLLLGFAAFDDKAIRTGIIQLADALGTTDLASLQRIHQKRPVQITSGTTPS